MDTPREHEASVTAKWVERLFNGLLGATVAWWTVAGLASVASFAPVHLAIGGLNLLVAGLFATREIERRAAGLVPILMSLPAVVAGALALHLAADPAAWPLWVQGLYTVGALGAGRSLLSLGKSFSVLPSVRAVVDQGPYAWVRHPAYAAQLVMVVALSLVIGGPLAAGLVFGTAVALAMRIDAEERLLGEEPAYVAYADRVRWRMLPGVW